MSKGEVGDGSRPAHGGAFLTKHSESLLKGVQQGKDVI